MTLEKRPVFLDVRTSKTRHHENVFLMTKRVGCVCVECISVERDGAFCVRARAPVRRGAGVRMDNDETVGSVRR